MSQMFISPFSQYISHILNIFLTSEEQTPSLQRTKWLAPTCPLFRGSTVIT